MSLVLVLTPSAPPPWHGLVRAVISWQARYNIAIVHRVEGDLDRAITELEHVVELDRQIGHPDLASDTATLEWLRAESAQDPGAN